MQCSKAIYPHSKFNYVSCTRLVENFSETSSGTPTGSNSSNNTATGSTTGSTTNVTPNSGSISSVTSSGNNGISCSCTGDASSNNSFSLSCTCTRKVNEGFADVMAIPPSAQDAMAAAGKGIASAAQGLASTVGPMATKAAVATGVSDMVNQLKKENECNKTSLHITIGVLVTVLIGLVAYIVYQQMKNKQQ
jgi:hypothetical protein